MRGISDEEARENLGGRLFAAAEALVPGSDPEFAGCILAQFPHKIDVFRSK
jgi:hypothetical protein